MDLTRTIEPNSDQLNADDLIAGPQTFTVERVSAGSAEQPVDVHLVELPGRPYRPSKSMRRVLVATWGKEGAVYAGRRLTLYRDPEVTFGRDKVGGIKISHLSHIEKRQAIALTVTRGRRAPHVVEPLVEDAPTPRALPTPDDIAAATDREALQGMWRQFPDGHPARSAIEARVAELDATPEQPELPVDGGEA
jgi:hypothetical protein